MQGKYKVDDEESSRLKRRCIKPRSICTAPDFAPAMNRRTDVDVHLAGAYNFAIYTIYLPSCNAQHAA